MAAVYPVSGNKCKGSHADATPWVQLYCLKGYDGNYEPIHTCATWRYFRVQCPKVNVMCNSMSGGYVAAITVCRQHLY